MRLRPTLIALTATLGFAVLPVLSQAAPLPPETTILGDNLDGWKQAGPGSFKMENGVATGHGGMGLLWYAPKKFKNFTLRVQFKAQDPKWNSGVFVRFPDPGNDPWVAVREGHELQIGNGDKPDTHTTGAVYDTQAASHIPTKPAGEWNDYEVTCVGSWYAVSVNGEIVNIYQSKRGLEGYVGLQNHDDGSPVQLRAAKIISWDDQADFRSTLAALGHTRADLTRHNNLAKPNAKWYEQMDIGPWWFNTFRDTFAGEPRVAALKGVLIRMGEDEDYAALFDTETLRLSSAYEGFVKWGGTPWTGEHGKIIALSNEKPIYNTASVAGWADATGSFADKRENPGFGNIPQGKFKAVRHHGERVFFDYTVGAAAVTESGLLENVSGQTVFSREFNVSGADRTLQVLVADEPGATWEISGDGRSATSKASAKKAGDTISVAYDRAEKGWDSLAVGEPSAKDSASKPGTFSIVSGPGLNTPVAMHEKDGAALLNDGKLPANADEPKNNFYFNDKDQPGRILASLGTEQAVNNVRVYTWHKFDRAPQLYKVYAATKSSADPAAADPAAAGWKLLAEVNTSGLGQGGRQGSAVYRPDGEALAKTSRLLFVFQNNPAHKEFSPFISEIDIYAGDNKGSPIKASSGPTEALSVLALGAPAGAKFVSPEAGRLAFSLPASAAARLKLSYSRGIDADALATRLAPPSDLKALSVPGPALYPETVVTKGVMNETKEPAPYRGFEDKEGKSPEQAGKKPAKPAPSSDAPYATDVVTVPSDNPWKCNVRAGGFDFFPDGDRAALSTWNGDVWVVSGLASENLEKLSWRRFASGLFEPLGLKIVNGDIIVNGRDQLTRLKDTNGDGEADVYESFNRDVVISSNFHEFTFDLQTDKAGNFWFSKASPVRGGGRGFDPIVANHGTIMKVSPDGAKMEIYATGLRAPGGLGVGPNGEITTGENEGSWQPRCKLNWIHKGDFLGVPDSAHGADTSKLSLPLCYFPMEVDNSSGSQVWVPESAAKFGLKPGELIHLSYGQSSLYRVLPQNVDGQMQGGVTRLPIRVMSSAMRARFHPGTGDLYVLGFRGWQTNAATECAFNRIRPTGKPLMVPEKLSVTKEGVSITFPTALDKEVAQDVASYNVSRWKYIRSKQYGSGEYSIDHPDTMLEAKGMESEIRPKNHDQVTVTGAKLQSDGRTVLLTLSSIVPAEQMRITCDLETAEGKVVKSDIYNTVHKVQ